MALKTQGTELYLINPAGDLVVAVGCVTSIDGLDATRDQIETTCLEAQDRTYQAGMKTNAAFTFGINFDPADSSHAVVEDLFQDGTEVAFAIGLADGTADPTVDSTGSEFDLPATRSWIAFRGYVSSFPLSMPLNDVIRATVGVQPSGPRAIVRKTP